MKSVYRGYNHHPEIVFIYSTEFQKIDKIRYSLGCLDNVCYVQFTVIVTFANISQGMHICASYFTRELVNPSRLTIQFTICLRILSQYCLHSKMLPFK